MNEKNVSTKVVTGRVRLSYVHLIEPETAMDGGAAKYSTSILIPKDDTATIEAVRRAVEAAYKLGEGRLRGNGRTVPPLSTLRTPLRDGDAERPDDEAYKGKLFLTARSTAKPGIVDRNLNAVTDPAEVYSGRWARVSISAFAYNNNGNRGIGMGLQNVQLLEDDEPLGGRSRPQDDFGTDEDDFLA